MPALYLTLAPLQSSLPVLSATRKSSDTAIGKNNPGYGSSAARLKVLSALIPSSPHPFRQVQGAVTPSLCSLLALGLCSIEILSPFQPAFAEGFNDPTEDTLLPFAQYIWPSSPASYTVYAPLLNIHSSQESPSVTEKSWKELVTAEECRVPAMETPVFAADHESGCIAMEIPVVSADLELENQNSMPKFNKTLLSGLFLISSSEAAEYPNPFLDYARVFSPAKTASLLKDINILEAEAGWRLRVITKSVTAPSISGKDLKNLWKPDDKTVIVIEDISSPNILNFNAGADVVAKIPRRFFLELQSRYGNQFFVRQEGEGEALMLTVQAIEECLRRPEGCKNVPGLTDDLYYLTLTTSIVGGCVFGFAARLPPSGRVEASWQWVVFLSPLWILLFVSFGVLPVVGRTSELEPLIKNVLGFAVGACALYLTPIFGPSPISKR